MLLRLLCGLIKPDSGRILWHNEDIADNPDYHADLTYIGHLTGIKQELTALENLQFLSTLSGLSGKSDCLDALAWAGLQEWAHSPAACLSYGQQRRIALARLKLETSLLWILDEPLAGLDQAMIGILKTLFSDHAKAGGILILTSHQAVDLVNAKHRHIDFHRSGQTTESDGSVSLDSRLHGNDGSERHSS